MIAHLHQPLAFFFDRPGFGGSGHAPKASANAAGHAVFKRKLAAHAQFASELLHSAHKGRWPAGQHKALLLGIFAHAFLNGENKVVQVAGFGLAQAVQRHMLVDAVHRVAADVFPMPEKHGDVPGLGVFAHIAHKRHYAHAPCQQQGGGVGLNGKAVAQRAPHANFVAGAQLGHAPRAFAAHLEETDHVPGGHVANAKRPRPGDIKPKVPGADHDELAGPPPSPFGAGEAKRIKTAFVSGLPKGDKIEDVKLARGWL